MTLENVRAGIGASLAEAAIFLSEKIKSKVDEVNAPKNIKDAISISPPQIASTVASIDIIISLKIAPAAGAFEYGSGIHATRGERAEYQIVPREASILAFPKERWPQYKPPPPAPDIFFFTKVMHPGVEERPYIRPAIQENKGEIARIIGKQFRAEILRGMTKLEVIS